MAPRGRAACPDSAPLSGAETAAPYCNDALSDPDTPWLFVSVTETDWIDAVNVLTFVKSPCSVTVNWLPNACDAALWYQAVKLGPTGSLIELVHRVSALMSAGPYLSTNAGSA